MIGAAGCATFIPFASDWVDQPVSGVSSTSSHISYAFHDEYPLGAAICHFLKLICFIFPRWACRPSKPKREVVGYPVPGIH